MFTLVSRWPCLPSSLRDYQARRVELMAIVDCCSRDILEPSNWAITKFYLLAIVSVTFLLL